MNGNKSKSISKTTALKTKAKYHNNWFERDGETISIRRVRQLRSQIRNETVQQPEQHATVKKQKRKKSPKRRKRLKKTHAIS